MCDDQVRVTEIFHLCWEHFESFLAILKSLFIADAVVAFGVWKILSQGWYCSSVAETLPRCAGS